MSSAGSPRSSREQRTPDRQSPAPRHADGPLVLDTRSLARVPGSTAQVERPAALPTAIGVEMIRLPAGTEVDLDLTLTCVEEGVLVTGSVSGLAEAECARCLTTLSTDVATELTEMYAYPGSAAAAGAEEDEVRLLDGEFLDLEPALVDAFGLDFPLAPTCESLTDRPCQDPDVPAPDGVSGEDTGRVDPRWAGLVEKFGPGSGE